MKFKLVEDLNESYSSSSIILPDGWEKDDRVIGSRYIYWSERYFADVSVTNTAATPKELDVNTYIIDKFNKTSDSNRYTVTVTDVSNEWDGVVQDAINKVDKLLKDK